MANYCAQRYTSASAGGPDLDFPEELATPLIKDIIGKQRHRFVDYPDWGDEDLFQFSMMQARQGWANYNAAKGKPSTFIVTCVKRRLSSLSRDLSRRLRRDRVGMAMAPAYHQGDAGSANDIDDDDLAEWLGSIHRTMRLFYSRGNIPLRHPFANHRYADRAQSASLMLLRRRVNASLRGLELLLLERPELLKAIGMQAAPRYSSLWDSEKSVRRLCPGAVANNRG